MPQLQSLQLTIGKILDNESIFFYYSLYQNAWSLQGLCSSSQFGMFSQLASQLQQYFTIGRSGDYHNCFGGLSAFSGPQCLVLEALTSVTGWLYFLLLLQHTRSSTQTHLQLLMSLFPGFMRVAGRIVVGGLPIILQQLLLACFHYLQAFRQLSQL